MWLPSQMGRTQAHHFVRSIGMDRQNWFRLPPLPVAGHSSAWHRSSGFTPQLPSGPLSHGLTVQLYFTQSSQKCDAENFLRMTTVMPRSRHCPTPTMFPVERQPGESSVPRHFQLSPLKEKSGSARWTPRADSQQMGVHLAKAPRPQAPGRRQATVRCGAVLCT